MNAMLYLFRNIEALKYMRTSKILFPDASAQTDMFFSRDFIEETINSVLLFFPTDNDHDYGYWLATGNTEGLNNWQRALVADYEQSPCPREVADYPIWGHKLLKISEASRREGRWGIKRLWYDTRDESLWWTRWGLISAGSLAVMFGLIPSITGIIQVVYAAKSGG